MNTLPISAPDPAAPRACLAFWPDRPVKLVHEIRASFPGMGTNLMLGVVETDPGRKSIRAVLLTLEGVTLLEASRGPEGYRVDRALPPLDRPGLASGLLDDVGLLFLPPGGMPTKSGRLADGGLGCLWERPGRGRLEVAARKGGWEITAYDLDGLPERRVRALEPGGGMSRELELEAAEGYGLSLRLIRTED